MERGRTGRRVQTRVCCFPYRFAAYPDPFRPRTRMAERRAPKWIQAFMDLLEKQCGMAVVLHTLYVSKKGTLTTNTWVMRCAVRPRGTSASLDRASRVRPFSRSRPRWLTLPKLWNGWAPWWNVAVLLTAFLPSHTRSFTAVRWSFTGRLWKNIPHLQRQCLSGRFVSTPPTSSLIGRPYFIGIRAPGRNG